jgi:putative tryptophan/tyrosine transport system substrate-binding protein
MRPILVGIAFALAQGLLGASAGLSADLVVLKSSETSSYQQALDSIRRHLPGHLSVKEYNLEGRIDRARDIGATIRGIQPQLVIAIGLKATLVARAELPNTPILFCMVVHPEEYGLPATNMVGIPNKVSPAAQLQQIATLIPTAHSIGLLYDEHKTGAFVAEARVKARLLGMTLIAVPVAHQEAIVGALHTLLPKIDLLWIVQDSTVVTEDSLESLMESSLREKVPIFTFSTTLVRRGALGALVIHPSDVGRQAARVAEAMLAHRGPSAPVMLDPELPQLALNLNTAEFIGLATDQTTIRTAAILIGGPGDVAQQEQTILKELLQ